MLFLLLLHFYPGAQLLKTLKHGEVYNQKMAEDAMSLILKLYTKEENDEKKHSLLKLQEKIMNIASSVSVESTDPVNEALASGSASNKANEKVLQFTKSNIGPEESDHQCPHCPNKYSTFKGLQKHVRNKHEGLEKVTAENYQVRNRVKCLLFKKNEPHIICGREIEKVRMVRHLRESHSIDRPDSSHEFRGFLSSDEGKTYSVCWRPIKALDPPATQIIPAAEDEDEQEEENFGEIEKLNTNDEASQGVEFKAVGPEETLEMEDCTVDEGQKVRDHSERHDDETIVQDSDIPKSTESLFLMEVENNNERSFHYTTDNSENISDMEVSGDWSETSFIVNVENNGSYHILNEGEEEQPADSQGSVVISGSSTRTTFEDNPMSPMSEYYRDSLAADSAHNTAHECLEVPVDKTHVVKVQYFTRMTNKRTIKEIEAPKGGKSARLEYEPVTKEESNDPEPLKNIGGAFDEPETTHESNMTDKEASDAIDFDSETSDVEDNSDSEGDSSEDECAEDDNEDDDEISNSQNRWQKRNSLKESVELSKLPMNEKFIAQFCEWWKSSGASLVTARKDTSTIRGTLNNLFYNMDSFLNYLTSESDGCSFDLSKLTSFLSDDCQTLPSPIGWITKVGGKSGQNLPARRREMLLAHQRLRSYIIHCLNETNFDKNIDQKAAMINHLKDIEESIEKKKLFSQLTKLYLQQKAQKQKMISILKPFEKENLHNCVRTWYKSKESEELELEALSIYNCAMQANYIRSKDFDRFCKIVFFEIAIFDKSRSGVIEGLKNEDYTLKKPTWVPPEMTDLEFNKLPKNCRLYTPPNPDDPPSSYEMDILGDKEGMKNAADQTVCISQRGYELLEKMR